MSSAAVFSPRPDLSGGDNLRGFIQSARDDLRVFGADLNFNDDVWDITDYLDLKGRGNKRVRLNFFAFSDRDDAQVPLQEPFLSFAKSYFRYMHGLRPTKSVHARLYALKAVGLALEQEGNGGHTDLLSAPTFDSAAYTIQRRYCDKFAYRIGSQLEFLAEFLTENRFVTAPVRWRNIVPRPADTERVGKEFDERRAAKLPSEAALTALPQLFHLAQKPLDVIVTSITAILLAAPSRISEIQLLPENCEVVQETGDRTTYRLRWWPSKGADPMLKPVYSGMAEVVKEAVAKLRHVSTPAREIAAWYEANPGKLYLPAGCEHLRSKTWIAPSDVARVIGVEDGRMWCQRVGVEIALVDGRSAVRLEDVERKVLELLPQGFPVINRETGLRYSEALLLVRKNELHAQRGTYLCMIEPVPTDCFNSRLGKEGARTIFDDHEVREPNGCRTKVTSHQFRHYLNTIAQMGGLSQLDIAKWSGRVDVRQNAAYDHVSSTEMLAQIREAVGDSSQMFGPLGKAPDRRIISRDEFAQLKVPTAHTTELGFCMHDYTMSPCEIHRDCINCEELVCVKGDSIKNAEVRRQLEEARGFLERAELASAGGQYGADRWVVHQRATVERLEQLCAILNDPAVPRGAFITLARPNPAAPPRLGRQEALGTVTQLKLIGGEA